MAGMMKLVELEDLEERIVAAFAGDESARVVSVYLFGSWAEGRVHRESDVDLGLLLDLSRLPTPKQRFEASLRFRGLVGRALASDNVDLVVLNDAPPLLGRRIVTQGRRIYCRDPELDHVFVRDVQLRAADLEPFLDRMRKIKLEALSPR